MSDLFIDSFLMFLVKTFIVDAITMSQQALRVIWDNQPATVNDRKIGK